MKPNIKNLIADLEKENGKIYPTAMAGTWKKSLREGFAKNELCFWFDTMNGSTHLVRINTITGEIKQKKNLIK